MIPDEQDRELSELFASEQSQIRADTVSALNELMRAAQRFGFAPASRERDILGEARELLEAAKRFLEAGEKFSPEQSNTRKGERDDAEIDEQ
jgi:hypothetical protein